MPVWPQNIFFVFKIFFKKNNKISALNRPNSSFKNTSQAKKCLEPYFNT